MLCGPLIRRDENGFVAGAYAVMRWWDQLVGSLPLWRWYVVDAPYWALYEACTLGHGITVLPTEAGWVCP